MPCLFACWLLGYRFEPAPVNVLLSEEVTGSLRQVKVSFMAAAGQGKLDSSCSQESYTLRDNVREYCTVCHCDTLSLSLCCAERQRHHGTTCVSQSLALTLSLDCFTTL